MNKPSLSPFAAIDRKVAGRWGKAVTEGGKDGEAGTRELARCYWYPAYVFLRRSGLEPEPAAVRTESVLTQVVLDPVSGVADDPPSFRSRLLALAYDAACIPTWQEPAIRIDRAEAEIRYRRERPGPPDDAFCRRWMLTILELAMADVATVYSARTTLFEAIRPYLDDQAVPAISAELASRLNLSFEALRDSVEELRHQYRLALRHQLAQVVVDERDIDDELAILLTWL
jgi:RNA polymerase sigma-70 factor (ECF subfamily)